MKKIIFLFGISIIGKVCFAQAPDWEWAKGIGGPDEEASSSVTTDASGNVYTTGCFSGTVDFNPGVGIFNLTAAGDQDIFISKLDNSGNFIWTKSCANSLSGAGISIKTDARRNVYVSGWFQGTVDFNPGIGIFNLTATGIYSAFIFKLDSNGIFLWAKGILGANYNDVSSIAVDSFGNVYTTGKFEGTVDYDPGLSVFNFTSNGSYDISIFKLDSSGNFIWAKQVGGFGWEKSNSIALDRYGNVYTIGGFTDSTDFDPGAGVFSLGGGGSFILKLGCGSGNFIWVKTIIDGLNPIDGLAIAVDNEGNIYSTGGFYGTCDFNPGGAIFNLTSFGDMDVFVDKLDSSGSFLWAKQIGGLDLQAGFSLAADGFGYVYVTGRFYSTVDFDPGVNVYNISSIGGDDIFIVGLDDEGALLYAKTAGGSAQEWGNSIALDASSNVFITTSYISPSIQFGNFTIVNANNLQNTFDILIAKLSICNSSSSILNENTCYHFASPSGNYIWTTSGIYHDTIPNSTGCDSIITINLTINSVDTSLTQIADTLTANTTSATYQWINCNNNFAAISGATNQTFTATTNGNYAVAVSQNGCTDTSACYTITGVGINEITTSNNFQLFPNPTADMVTVQLNSPCSNCTIEISNVLGEILFTDELNQKSKICNLQSFPSGIYFIKVKSDKWSEVKRVVKE